MRKTLLFWNILFVIFFTMDLTHLFAEDSNEESYSEESLESSSTSSEDGQNNRTSSKKKNASSSSTSSSRTSSTKKEKRKYFVEDIERVDAGKFHVGFLAGGNFYIEPKYTASGIFADDYFKDFGFQGGMVFDYDYEDFPLGLRGFIGYKYILNSVHVFDFDGVVRYLMPVSDKAKFALGMGVSLGLWYRKITTTSLDEELILLPSFIVNAGFDFNPFLVDFKWLINRFGSESTITGLELYFGVRL